MSNNTNDKGNNILKTGIVIGIVVIVALLGVIIYLLVGKGEDEPKRNVIITQDNAEEVIEQMTEQEVIPVTYYKVTMSTEWHFTDGSAVSEDAYIANDITNSSDVYVDIFLKGDEENAIYKSPIIPRGAELENIALDEVLEKGVYDCVCIYHLVDEDQNTLSTVRITLNVTIDN